MAIDINEYLTAERVIRQTQEKLFVLTKNYFENNRSLTVEVSKEKIKGYKSGRIISFETLIKLDDLSVGIHFCYVGDDWGYYLECKELGMNSLDPPKKNNCTIQGNMDILFICNLEKEHIEKRQQINMKRYPN